METNATYSLGTQSEERVTEDGETMDECICEHCREAGTCFGCTSGVCP